MVVVQGPLLAWASSRLSDRVLMAGGSVVLCLGFVALFSEDTALIYAGAVLIASGNGLMWPTFMSVLSKSAGKRLQGAVQGFASSAGAVASILGLIGGGVAYVRFGASIFLIAAAVILLVAVTAAKYSPLEEAAKS
jgi:MFS family permease